MLAPGKFTMPQNPSETWNGNTKKILIGVCIHVIGSRKGTIRSLTLDALHFQISLSLTTSNERCGEGIGLPDFSIFDFASLTVGHRNEGDK